MDPSGTGRFIADSWFSDQPLPLAYTHPAAAGLRQHGVSDPAVDRQGVREYLSAVDVRGAIEGVVAAGKAMQGAERLRGLYLVGLGECFRLMWDLAMECLGEGEKVPYARCVGALLGGPPISCDGTERRRQVAELLRAAGHAAGPGEDLAAAVAAWRGQRLVSARDIAPLAARVIAELDALTAKNVMPHLPAELGPVPRANVRFLPIENAWFSGSMNYLGRARRPDGKPEYEATYELNAALEISVPEFWQLVSHEVVPGHVTTFAYLQDLYVRGKVGFEASVLTMNTRPATLFEGIANNAILMAHGVTEVSALPDRDLQIGVLLALLQDDAKNQASYLTWQSGLPKDEVARTLRADFLVSQERADKLSGSWGRHPLLGRMYLPAYRAGTELVAHLRRTHAPERILPALYGCAGIVDAQTLETVLSS